MKWLFLATILLCLFGVMACENEVTGDYPIVNVDDTLTVFLCPDDDLFMLLTKRSCNVTVQRPYGVDATIEYSDMFFDIKHVHIVNIPGPGDNDT